ncbi:MAG TPA: hypothetical protein VGO58_07145, partial [Chitinophagaceae bacterium]|nr:hypothetical protein [Chitinophagaceae bacterium]
GTYGVGNPATAANTVIVQVNVTTPGAYTITTNTVGGLTFSKTDIFSATGNQNVTLNASGTPTIAGSNTFTVGTAGCTFAVPVVGPAVFTFPGSPGACTVATVAGTYVKGTPLTTTNTVTAQVNVTTLGSYTITTNTVAGMTFSKSGVFTIPGIQTVILNGAGNPSVAGTHTFTIGTGGCTFEVIATNPPAGAGIYNCKIDGVYTSFTDRAEARTLDDFWSPAKPYLYLNGYTGPPDGNVVPQFQIFITKNDDSPIGTGTYNENGIITPGYRIEIDYTVQNPDLSTTIWNTSSTLFPPPNPPFTIIVTQVTATRVKGTFSGKLTNPFQGSTLIKTITEGSFDLPIQN